jgi:hypothetical protein
MPMLFDTSYPSSFGSSLSFLFKKKENVHRLKARITQAKSQTPRKEEKN